LKPQIGAVYAFLRRLGTPAACYHPPVSSFLLPFFRHRLSNIISGVLASLLVTLSGCGSGAELPPAARASAESLDPDALFVDRAVEVGLDFVHFNGMSGNFYMAEVTGSGGGLVDYDGDGDLDVYLVQGTMIGLGRTLEQALFPPRHPQPLTDRLYRNDLHLDSSGQRQLRFTDVTDQAGLSHSGYGMGMTSGDYDNDGDVDLYITNFRSNQLLRNTGAGRFEDVTDAAGVDDPRWSVPATFFDFDRDGWLDLFVGNYIAADLSNPTVCGGLTGAREYCGPGAYPPEPDRLFHNRGDGTFEEVTAAAGLSAGFGGALGVIASDLNGDGWLDLYVANDGAPNNLWINQRDGTFRDEALLAGASVNANGRAEASMGVDAADFDGDGDDDLFMAHLTAETNTLFVNNGQGLFSDATIAVGLAAPSRSYTSFGTAWLDYDNDSWLDLVIVNGAVKEIEALGRQHDPFPLHQPNQLFRNQAGRRFREVSRSAGKVFELSEVSRGAAIGDLDNDGDSDILVINNNGAVRWLENQRGQQAHWLGLELRGGDPGRDMLGARVAVYRPAQSPLWRRVRTDGSFCSVNDPRVLIGLGEEPAVDKVRVLWPGGTVEEWTNLKVDSYNRLERGAGTAVSP